MCLRKEVSRYTAFGRFPVTPNLEQLDMLLSQAAELREFIGANKSRLRPRIQAGDRHDTLPHGAIFEKLRHEFLRVRWPIPWSLTASYIAFTFLSLRSSVFFD
jgi:hypothetical protein